MPPRRCSEPYLAPVLPLSGPYLAHPLAHHRHRDRHRLGPLQVAADPAAAEGAKEEATALGDELWVTLTAVNTAVPVVPFSCRLCGSYDHAPRDCPTNVCRHCNQTGHFANVRLVFSRWLH